MQHQRKTSNTLGQRVCLELNNPPPPLHHPMDVCLLFHFTEEGKHLEVIFPLAFHLFHHLPLWETLKASAQFHWKDGKTPSCLLTLSAPQKSSKFPTKSNPVPRKTMQSRDWYRLPIALALVLFVLIVLTSQNLYGNDWSTLIMLFSSKKKFSWFDLWK